MTDAACVLDDDFPPIGDTGLSVDAYTLVSRNVDCRRSAGQLVRLDVDLDIKRNPTTGQIISYAIVTNPGGDPGPNTTRNRLTYGEALIQSRMSISGDSYSLTKRVSIQARVFAFYPDINYPTASGSIPGAPRFASFTVEPQVACISASTAGATCGSGKASEITLSLPAAGPPLDREWANSSAYLMNFNWIKPAGQYADVESFRATFDRFNYKMQGGKYEIAGTGPNFQKSWVSSNLGATPWIRCDRGMAQVNSSGCVFKDAAAVFDVQAISNAAEGISHIADAQRRQSHPDQPLPSPGVFKMLEGSQAVADPASTGSNALQRLQNESKQNSNRYKSCRRDNPNAIINERRPINASDSCKNNGVVITTSPCSCDEYPFASTWQGAHTTGVERVSAKYILAAENNAAGGGAYKGKLLQLRVIDFTDHSATDSMDPQDDNFWVWTGPISVPR